LRARRSDRRAPVLYRKETPLTVTVETKPSNAAKSAEVKAFVDMSV
jgi:hypothetical protein